MSNTTTVEEVEEQRRETLNDRTVDELRQLVDEMNEDRTVRIPYGSNKDATIANIMAQDFYEFIEPHQSFAKVESGAKAVPLSKLKRCPLNPRHEVDYQSKSLQDSIDRANGLTKAITVVHASELGEDEDVYYALTGNRSLENLRTVVTERWDEDPETFVVDVIVRTYDEDGDVEAQILSDLESDNEEALDLSPVDKLKLVNARLDKGRSKSSIARERGVSAAYITELTKLNVLPDRMLELIHFGSRLDELEGMDAEQLESFGVPFDEDDDGNVTPKGISYSNGLVLAGEFPSSPNKGDKSVKEYQTAMDEWREQCDELGQELLDNDELTEAATTLSKGAFKKWVAQNLHEPTNTEGSTAGSKEESSDNNDSSTTEVTGNEGGYSGVGSDHELVCLLYEDGDAFADRLEEGNIHFVEDWRERLAQQVRLMDTNVIRALRTLFVEDIIDEFEVAE